VIVDADGHGDYLHPEAAVLAGERRIRITAGEYILDKALEIVTPDVWIEGAGVDAVTLVQSDPGSDGVRLYADGAQLSGLTVDAATADAQAALVIGDASDVSVSDNRFLGSQKKWSIYAAGPKHVEGTLDDLARSGDLNTNNVIARNHVVSGWAGDAFCFAGQSGGRVEDNVIEGTLNVLISRDSVVVDNWIVDAPGPGMTINNPTRDLTVERNTIRDSFASGIRVGPQDIHPQADEERNPGLAIIDNVIINSGLFGVEVDGAEDLTLQGNLIDGSFFDGVYLHRTDRTVVVDNTIQDSALCAALPAAFEWSCTGVAGVFLQALAIETLVEDNTFSNLAELASHAVRSEIGWGNESTHVGDNTLLGEFPGGAYALAGG
jgi:parallel beta-helix repeat protein